MPVESRDLVCETRSGSAGIPVLVLDPDGLGNQCSRSSGSDRNCQLHRPIGGHCRFLGDKLRHLRSIGRNRHCQEGQGPSKGHLIQPRNGS